MKIICKLLMVIFAVSFLGCETVHDTTKGAGTYIGKGADAIGGITEGAAEGYSGTGTDSTSSEDNPYGR